MTIINTVAGSSAKLAQKEVVPTSFPTVVEPPEGYDGLSKATVNAPENLSAENIKAGVDIAGVVGGYDNRLPEQEKSVKATAFPTDVTPDDGKVLSKATVTAPENLVAENIRKDVGIAGVVGTYDPQPDLETVTLTPTVLPTTVVADAGYDGLKQVNVEKPVDLESENIKAGVNIAGVVGSYSPGVEGMTDGQKRTWDALRGRYPSVLYSADIVAFFSPKGFNNDYLLTTASAAELSMDYNDVGEGGYTRLIYSFNLGAGNDHRADNTILRLKNLNLRAGYDSSHFVDCYFHTVFFENCGPDISAIFQNCRFTDNQLNVPEGIKTIGRNCFADIRGYNPATYDYQEMTLTLPSTIIEIWGDRAVEVLGTLIMNAATPPTVGSYRSVVISGKNGGSIIVPKGTLEAYKSATNWSALAGKMVEASE